MSEKLNHPCKGTCSGYNVGYTDGRQWERKRQARHVLSLFKKQLEAKGLFNESSVRCGQLVVENGSLRTHLDVVRIKLHQIVAMAGHPDAAEGCRNIIKTSKELLKALDLKLDQIQVKSEKGRCACGEWIYADTEDWPEPLCYECYMKTLDENECKDQIHSSPTRSEEA